MEKDVDVGSQLGRAAFGCAPDTVNFWFGYEGAVSVVHKDPYENMCVAPVVCRGCGGTAKRVGVGRQPVQRWRHFAVWNK